MPTTDKGNPVHALARGFLIAAALTLVFAAACFITYQAGNDGLWGFTAAGLFLAAMLAASAAAVWSGQPALLILVMVIDLFTVVGGQHAGTDASAQPFPPGPIFDTIAADDGIFRTANEGPLTEHIGYGYRFEEITGASPLRLAAYDRLLTEAPRPLLWRLLNVKYVITWRTELEVPAERLAEQPGVDGKPIYVYRLSDPAPRARLTGRATVEPDADAALSRALAAGFDPANEVIVSAAPDPAPDPACGGAVEWIRRDPELLALRVTTDAPCVLTLSEIAYPGWEARIDGVVTPILAADGILRAVALPAGTHALTFSFRPPSVVTGALISLLTVILAAIGLLAARLAEGRFGPDAAKRAAAPTFPR